jgi:WD40 repeat protein
LVAVLAVLVAGLATLLVVLAELRAESQRRAREEAEWVTYTSQLALAQDAIGRGKLDSARAELDGCPADLRGWEYYHLRQLCTAGPGLTLKAPNLATSSMCWSPDNKHLAIAGHHTMVEVWDVTSGHEVPTPGGYSGVAPCVCWSPDGTRLACAHLAPPGESRPLVWVRDAATGKETFSPKGELTGPGFPCVCWSPDGTRLACAGFDQAVKVWDVQKGQEALPLQGHTNGLYGVCWSPDGKRLFGVGPDDSFDYHAVRTCLMVRAWDAVSGQETVSLRGQTIAAANYRVCWSPDGSRFALARDLSGRVTVWDAATGQQAFALEACDGRPNLAPSVCWSPDGKRLATGGEGGTVKVWDAIGGREVLTLKDHADAVTSVCWSPDGKRLASGSVFGEVEIRKAQ